MSGRELFSIRMRASAEGRHISGAERIAPFDELYSVAAGLVSRLDGRRVMPDSIVITMDRIESGSIRYLDALDVINVDLPDMSSCREAAEMLLLSLGVAREASAYAFKLLSNGPAGSGGCMRGAVIMDSKTGERLEPDKDRGIRASRFDWSSEARRKIDVLLQGAGLTHFRTREALALATKVANAPGMIAELCSSDESDYTAGYVASLKRGYVRFPFMKDHGSTYGGRIFFVRREGLDMAGLIHYLEKEPVLISGIGTYRTASAKDLLI